MLKKFTSAMLCAVGLCVLAFATPAPARAFDLGSVNASGLASIWQQVKATVTHTAERVYLLLPGDKPGLMVLDQAAWAMSNLRSAQASADLSLTFACSNLPATSVLIHADGPVQLEQLNDPQSYRPDLHVTGSLTVQGSSVKADANLKMTDKRLYFLLNAVPTLPSVDLTSLQGKWLWMPIVSGKAGKVNPQLNDRQRAEWANATQTLLTSSQVSSAQKLVKNDHSVYVISISVPKTALQTYLQSVQQIDASSTPLPPTTIASFLNQLGDIKLTVWIDRQTYFVRYVELPLTYTRLDSLLASPTPSPETAAGGSPTGANLSSLGEFHTLTTSLQLSLDQYNQTVQFVEPADAQSLSDLSPQATAAAEPVQPSELPTLTPQQKFELLQLQQNSR